MASPTKKLRYTTDHKEHISLLDDDVCATLEIEVIIDPDNQMNSVFDWDDPESKLKKVTVVMTLPSGTKNVKVLVGTVEGTGITSEIIIKYPWSEEYMDPKVIFKTRDNKDSKYYLDPEAMTFKSKPAENIPGLPVIIKEPLSVGTSSKQLLTAWVISSENTLALPSSRVIIETSPS